jgi:hypothetical protein
VEAFLLHDRPHERWGIRFYHRRLPCVLLHLVSAFFNCTLQQARFTSK